MSFANFHEFVFAIKGQERDRLFLCFSEQRVHFCWANEDGAGRAQSSGLEGGKVFLRSQLELQAQFGKIGEETDVVVAFDFVEHFHPGQVSFPKCYLKEFMNSRSSSLQLPFA